MPHGCCVVAHDDVRVSGTSIPGDEELSNSGNISSIRGVRIVEGVNARCTCVHSFDGNTAAIRRYGRVEYAETLHQPYSIEEEEEEDEMEDEKKDVVVVRASLGDSTFRRRSLWGPILLHFADCKM